MADSVFSRLKHAWNVFMARDPTGYNLSVGEGSYFKPGRFRYTRGNERTIITSIYNRISNDAAGIELKHVRIDENGRYLADMKSGLNTCLTLEANTDQTGRALRQDIVESMLDEGTVAIVPVVTDKDPRANDAYSIYNMRAGKIVCWYPQHVDVELYNEKTGKKQVVRLEKKQVAIVENPFYAVMNEPNSTMQRLLRKLYLLDAVDEQTSSGKLDLIIQLPYTVRSPLRQSQAEERVKQIENQLTHNRYGIAYADATEKITQLNRSVDNNLMKQIEYLTTMLYSQLGITQAVLDGTADDKTMLNYFNRTVEPILAAIADEMNRKFLTPTARTQGQRIQYFRDPFKLVPVNSIAEIADRFTQNAILSSNEIRQIIGMKPSNDPTADELRNKNLNPTDSPIPAEAPSEETAPAPDTGGENRIQQFLNSPYQTNVEVKS